VTLKKMMLMTVLALCLVAAAIAQKSNAKLPVPDLDPTLGRIGIRFSGFNGAALSYLVFIDEVQVAKFFGIGGSAIIDLPAGEHLVRCESRSILIAPKDSINDVGVVVEKGKGIYIILVEGDNYCLEGEKTFASNIGNKPAYVCIAVGGGSD
jgi:hypothetical protein